MGNNDQGFYSGYENESGFKTAGVGNDKYSMQTASLSSDNLSSGLAKMATVISTPRLFLILSMIVYAVIAYSKKEGGVQILDLSTLIFFISFIVLLYFVLMIAQLLYRQVIRQIDEIVALKWYKKIFAISKKFISQNKKLFLIIIIIFLMAYLYIHEPQFIKELSIIIKQFNNLQH